MEIRHLNDMKEVLCDQEWAKTAQNFELYYMHRGVKEKDGLRYDITIIPSLMLGKEFGKTKGHEHLGPFQELYIVLKGQALYLIQKTKGSIVEDVYAVKAKKGQAVIVPTSYGHITINPAKKELIEANWTDEKCENIYDLFSKNHGACYYYTKTGWIKNKNYKSVPKLRLEKPLKSMPKNLDFLYGKSC
ncbi:MAG: glucose-6-phosphate isomerase family protein [bacterium]